MSYIPVRGLAKLDEIMETGKDTSKVYQNLCISGTRPRYFNRGASVDGEGVEAIAQAYRHGKLFFTEF